MDGILLINKPKNMTSRDVVNKISNILHTKKVGHTGTLDPIATGVLILCIGKYTKLVDMITSYEKEYIASVKVGIKTDTLDISGNIIETSNTSINKTNLERTLNSFKGKYMQEVPLYSAVKINGKKLYEYARNNEIVDLPKREVEIKNIVLQEFNNENFTFKVLVSKGTYIRSLINDIGNKLSIPLTMSDLKRTKQGNFNLENCYEISDIENNNYKLLNIKDIFNFKTIKITDDNLLKKISNGVSIDNIYDEEIIMFEHNNKIIAIYKLIDNKLKPYKMFL